MKGYFNTKHRIRKIMSLVPKSTKSVLDIGSRGEIFKKVGLKTISVDVVENADINQDLNTDQKLKFKKNSFDLVVLNQILEHLNK